jgi:hypothetical protein
MMQGCRMKRVILIGALLLVAAAAVGLAYWFYPRTVDFEAQGMKYRLGTEAAVEERPLKVSIQGKIYRNFKGERTFKGTIGLEGEDIPVPEDQRTVELKRYRSFNAYALTYPFIENGKPRIYSQGTLFVNDDFSKIAIALIEHEADQGHWGADDGLMIAAPALNREEAVVLSNEVMREYLDGHVLK